MKPTPLLALFVATLSSAALLAADAPAPAAPPPAPSAASSPANTTTPATTATPATPAEPSWTIPTPLAAGQQFVLFPEGVPGGKDIGPEQITGGTYTNVSNPRLIYSPATPGAPSSGAAVIFCAGGGYVHVALGQGMNSWLNPLGIATFNLIYRCKEFGAPAPQQDVLRAVRFVRAHAKEFGIDPNKIGVMGASAGGHVAASAATLFDDPLGKTGAALDQVSARPDFAVLIFSVLTMEPPFAHADSKNNLLGRNPTQEMIDQYSLEKHVTRDTPPTFIIHSEQDSTVKEENDLLFYTALRKAGVRAELHLYPDANHGSGMEATAGPTSLWPKLCEEWMRWNGWIPKSDASLLKIQTHAEAGVRGAGRGARGTVRGAPTAPPAPATTPPAAPAPTAN
jgi:acetyl esterase/lipase